MATAAEPDHSVTPVRELLDRQTKHVASIDFGTVNCSLAYSIDGQGIENIDIGQNDGKRNPNVLLLVTKKKESGTYSINIGNRAQNRFYSKSTKQADRNAVLYFECFKMQLRQEKVTCIPHMTCSYVSYCTI